MELWILASIFVVAMALRLGFLAFHFTSLEHRPVHGRHAIFLEAVGSENRFFNLQEFVFWQHSERGAGFETE